MIKLVIIYETHIYVIIFSIFEYFIGSGFVMNNVIIRSNNLTDKNKTDMTIIKILICCSIMFFHFF
jgi:hypothetical protein